jgi:hypothetical protein
MISSRTSSVPKDDGIPRLLYHDLRCSQACRQRSQACCRLFQVLPGLSSALPGAPRLVVGAPRLAAGAPRCSQVHLKATASVQYTLGFDHPGLLVRQLSDTPRGSQCPTYILLMTAYCIIRRWTVSRSQPVFHLVADHVILNSLHSHN